LVGDLPRLPHVETEFETDLSKIVGAHLLTDPELIVGYSTDWTRRWAGYASAVVRPGSTDEVAAVVRACAAAGVPIVPQGGNTGLVGGSVPMDGEVVLSLTRLADLGPVSPDGQVTVGAGATLASVQRHAANAGWAVGVDLGARDSATIGGMVATNAGGVNVLRYGMMREQVVGIEAVLADGSIVRRLSGVAKDNTGYQLAGLLTGSEGTLGVISAVRLRLVEPLPRRALALLGLASVADAVTLAGDLRRRLPSITATELFLDEGLEIVLRHAIRSAPFAQRHAAYVLMECGETTANPSDALVAALAAVGFDGDALLETDPEARERLWQLRERHTESVSAEGVPHKLDVAVPIPRMAELVERLGPVVGAVAPGTRCIVFGHLGDGNLHVNLLGPAPDDEAPDDAVLRLVLELGGTISAEHGIGRAKRRWLVADRGEADVAAMRAIKRALDPAGILNPGVLLPDEG
jgi:FAD/FMN-containing dehydrogenase